jgi:arsenite methyltransferase
LGDNEKKTDDQVRNKVRDYYANIAVNTPNSGCGCGTTESSCCGETYDAENVSQILGYSKDDIKLIPEGSNMGLGCGNPQAVATLKESEVVLDLGSGGGFDVFLAAKLVGDTGKVIGVDMTPEMITKSRENTIKGNYSNVEFRLGEIEHIPVADASVDVIMSNCVINLSPDKPSVYQDAFRVLKSGGRLAIADVVATQEVPDELRQDMKRWSACASGAMVIDELEQLLEQIGFEDIRIVLDEKTKELVKEWAQGSELSDIFVSSYITAVKP